MGIIIGIFFLEIPTGTHLQIFTVQFATEHGPFTVDLPTNSDGFHSVMWVKQCHKPAMTGNGNHTTTNK